MRSGAAVSYTITSTDCRQVEHTFLTQSQSQYALACASMHPAPAVVVQRSSGGHHLLEVCAPNISKCPIVDLQTEVQHWVSHVCCALAWVTRTLPVVDQVSQASVYGNSPWVQGRGRSPHPPLCT
jgi:hypothetical protein